MLKFVTIHPSLQMHNADCDITRGHTEDDAIEHHYRVTRPEVYASPNCPGHKDPSARQGHYTDACCPTHAARRIQERLVGDLPSIVTETFDVQVWR